MRTVLSLCVIISTALACPIKKPSCSGVPKICPSEWDIKEFESQYVSNKKYSINILIIICVLHRPLDKL